MIYSEIKKNLFEMDSKYTLAHCISSDCAMGAGIAVEFQKRFGLKQKLLYHYSESDRAHSTCIYENKVLNLITKEKYWHKPTEMSMKNSLRRMKEVIIENDIKLIAMPKIGAGLDRLSWTKVKEMIYEIFGDLDIEIVVCKL